jgi:hypothetical protein
LNLNHSPLNLSFVIPILVIKATETQKALANYPRSHNKPMVYIQEVMGHIQKNFKQEYGTPWSRNLKSSRGELKVTLRGGCCDPGDNRTTGLLHHDVTGHWAARGLTGTAERHRGFSVPT